MDDLRLAITERIKERTGLQLHQDRNVLVTLSKLGSSHEIVSYLLREADVAVNEGSHYGCYGEGYIRIV
ncbi:hypothetical protein [Alkaliphilus metalliredigens]|uniref:hypothetical protein n=1 Tax=Alkaliphilus metalliredigens TaxID=208226 RepID=UPI0018DBC284|nr:hypothetical protein [Alkaliphilus metalliredigens]